MNISDLMMMLQVIKDERGDLPVFGDRGEPELIVLEEKDELDIWLHIG